VATKEEDDPGLYLFFFFFLTNRTVLSSLLRNRPKGYTIRTTITEKNKHSNTKLSTPKGEEQSPKAIGVIREKDFLPTKLLSLNFIF
jgi:hypothetical protein